MCDRRTRFLPTLLALAGVAFLSATAPARAGGIGNALSNLLSGTAGSVNGPGYFSSEARGVYLMGGGEVRFPTRTSPTLISVNPPYIYAGCGGISAYFGGFSYISGSQIKQLIQEIAQNSVGLVTMLAIKELCPQCADVIAQMQAIAQKAANLSINSCNMSKWLIQRGAGLMGGTANFSDNSQSTLAATEAAMGKSSGYLSDMYNSVTSADTFLGKLNSDITAQEKAAGVNPNSQTGLQTLCASGGTCNTVWTLLGDSDLGNSTASQVIWDRTFLMNLMGTKVICPPSECKNMPVVGYKIYPPSLGFAGAKGPTGTMYNVYRLFLCGVNWQNAGKSSVAQAAIAYYCSGSNPSSQTGSAQAAGTGFTNIQVFQCANQSLTSDGNVPCLNIEYEKLSASFLGQESGYLPYVANILDCGVQNVIENHSIESNCPELIPLLELVPAPLYQAINAAAVFPSAAQEVVTSMSLYTANLLMDDEIRHIARVAARIKSGPRVSHKQLEQLYSFLGGMIWQAKKNNESFVTALNMQEALMQQIRQINAAVADETVAQGLLGSTKFGLAVTQPQQP